MLKQVVVDVLVGGCIEMFVSVGGRGFHYAFFFFCMASIPYDQKIRWIRPVLGGWTRAEIILLWIQVRFPS